MEVQMTDATQLGRKAQKDVLSQLETASRNILPDEIAPKEVVAPKVKRPAPRREVGRVSTRFTD